MPTPLRRPALTAGDMLRSPTTPDGPTKTGGFADIDGLDEANEALAGAWLTVGTVLTSNDPEAGHWVTVRDDCGSRWRRTDGGDHDGAANWEKTDVDYFEPESWTKVAGNYGPVTVVEIDE
jgi:hypothetical protein